MTTDAEFDGITLRRPEKQDGAALHTLVRINPPLDMNSVYCNVLQCTHFPDTCIVAERDKQLIGFVTGYLVPAQPHIYFIWQMAVSPEGRGHGLAGRMIRAVLAREYCRGVKEINTTITQSNQASRVVFAQLAEREGGKITETGGFFSTEVLGGHAAESLFRIRPLNTPGG